MSTSTEPRREIYLDQLGVPVSHYTHAVTFGNLLFISGQVGRDHETQTISPDVAEQARQLFRNMSKILDAAGATFAEVLKVTVYLTDIDDHTLVTPVRAEFFGDHRPASTLVQVVNLVRPGLKVEVDAIVGLRGNPSAAA